jgi:hypothetical protein
MLSKLNHFPNNQIVSEIEKIECKIKTLETEIAAIPKEKEAILKKYL